MLKTPVQFQKSRFINKRNEKHCYFWPFFVDCGGHIGIPTAIKNLNLKGPPELSKPVQFQPNPSNRSREEDNNRFQLFLAMAAILFELPKKQTYIFVLVMEATFWLNFGWHRPGSL